MTTLLMGDAAGGKQSNMAQSLDIVIKNDFSELGGLCLDVNGFLEKHSMAARVVYAVNLAIEEVLTNIIKYGYDDSKPHDISVHLTLEGEGLRLVLVDDGRRFDVDKAPEPDMSIPASDREVGGLGIHLVRNMLDTLTYTRNGNKNTLELTIKGDAA